MRIVVRALWALCLTLPLPLAAQQGDAFVLPRGMMHLRAGAEFSQFDSRFGRGDGVEPLATDLLAPLTSRTFAPLRPLEAELNRFFEAGGATPAAGEETLRLGTPDVRAAANVREVPFSVAVGVLPGLEVELRLPIVREELLLTRHALAGGTVGANPAPQANAELLASLGEEWRALGESALLPTDSSALGRELQRLVGERIPDGVIDLPDSPADAQVLNAFLVGDFLVAPLESRLGPWRAGDAEVAARYRLLSTLGPAPFPTDSARLHYRAALSVSARLPTGSEPDSTFLLPVLPATGQSGFGIGLDGDVFYGSRLWTTVSLQYARRGEVEVLRRVVDPEQPLAELAPPRAVRWTPGDRLSLRVAPRFRLTDAVSLGAQYAFARVGEGTFGGQPDASLLDTASGSAQTAAFGGRYSTLPAYWAGASLLPLEVSLTYETTLDGPAGAVDASRVVVQATVYHRLWGARP